MFNSYTPIKLQSSKLLLLCLLLSSFASLGQQKEWKQTAFALEKKQYTKALRLSEKTLKKYGSKEPQALMYKAQALYYLYTNPTTQSKFPNGLKDALKVAEKALATEKGNGIRLIYAEFLQNLADANNKEGEIALKAQRYAKASQHFKLSIDFNPNDTLAAYALGVCYWEENQKERAVYYFKQVAQNNFSAFSENVSPTTYQFKAFRNLAEYYMENKSWDTAGMYVKMGLEMFPNDHQLLMHRYGLYRVKVKDMPPSFDYLNYTRDALLDYPSDSFFLVKQNALYLFLFKQSLKNGEVKTADSLLGLFVADRLERNNKANRHVLIKYDIFIGENPQTIFRKLLDYSMDKYHKDIFAWLVQKWTSEVLKVDKVSLDAYLGIANKEFKQNNTAFAVLMLQSEFKRPTRKGEGEALLMKTVLEWTPQLRHFLAQDYMYEILTELYQGKQKTQIESVFRNLSFAFISNLADGNHFFRAYDLYHQSLRYFPTHKKYLQEELLRELAIKDFKQNYVGSRIAAWKKKPVEGEIAFETDMLPSNCEPGTLSDEILERVAQRVNYFRRQSGVRKPIYFVTDLSIRCQFAALIFEANRNLTHHSVDGLRCHTQYGSEGAEKSLLVKTNSPSIAITALMGDKHASQGNRRWLQFPITYNMGFGAGPNSQVLWIMDEGNKEDTSYYKENFVAWPHNGFTPKRLVFEKWSFSLLADLQGATVSVKDDKGKDVKVDLEKLEPGYGMPTLVFTPQINWDKESLNDEKFTVTVKLKTGKTFVYTCTFIQL